MCSLPRALEMVKQNRLASVHRLADNKYWSHPHKRRLAGIPRAELTSDTPKKANFRPKSNFPVGHLRPHLAHGVMDRWHTRPTPLLSCHGAKCNDFASKRFILLSLVYTLLFHSPNLFNDASAHLWWMRRSHVVNFGLTEGMVTWPRRLTGLAADYPNDENKIPLSLPRGFCCVFVYLVFVIL